ncbi:hypothetical protein NP233_g8887 [Leucocoprinus birnbaumii]|uniref:Uncharacterized protein n=1 Tax=Leucocoprinus birnbaumii TaxID=56174 RepID=A0AAD5VLR4_9AGAR|nr:hypothetical protein NP233_g8887 [Leucocoprinus birnbaumii]
MTFKQNTMSSTLIAFSILGLMGVAALPVEHQHMNATHGPKFMSEADAIRIRDLTPVNFPRGAPSSRCSALTLDDAQRMPGWDKLVQYAKDTWGDGSWNIVVNPKEYPDSSANACTDDSPVKIEPKGIAWIYISLTIELTRVMCSGQPQCDQQSADIGSDNVNADGTDSVSITIGDSQTGSWTVSRTSTFSASASFEVGFDVPELFEAKATFETSTSVSNTQGNTFGTSHSTQRTVQSVINDKPNQTCKASMTVKSCKQDGTGKIRVAATGWVWFNYNDKTAPKAGPSNDKHYKWAASIDNVLSLDERTSWIEFSGSMSEECQEA